MRWVWGKIGLYGQLQALFVIWAVMAGALYFGGGEILRLFTHDEIEGRVDRVLRLCTIDCDKPAQRPAGAPREAMRCDEIRAMLAEHPDCRPRPARYYAVRFTGTDGRPALKPLPAGKFDKPYSQGDRIPVLRDPDVRALVYPPPDTFSFIAFIVGIGLFYWLVLRRLARWFPANRRKLASAKSTSPNSIEMPKTRGDTAKTRAPIVKARKPKRGRYIVKGPIRTRVR